MRKQKGTRGRKEGTGSCQINRKEKGRKERADQKRHAESRAGGRGESRGREREGHLCALIALPGTLPALPLGLTLGKHQAEARLCGAGQDHLSPQLPSEPG